MYELEFEKKKYIAVHSFSVLPLYYMTENNYMYLECYHWKTACNEYDTNKLYFAQRLWSTLDVVYVYQMLDTLVYHKEKVIWMV